jgi:hypothetical protein
VHALALGRDLDRDHLVEHLDPALHLRGLRRLVPEPVDEGLHALDLVVLLALALPQQLHARLTLAQVLAVVAGVIGERAETDLRDACHDGVEEEPVVRDEDYRVRIVGEILLEPVARVQIEVVRGFVEQQQARTAQEQLRQRDAHLPAAGERLGRLVQIVGAEPETAQHGRDLEIDAVALETAEGLLQLAVPREHRLVLRQRHVVVAEPPFELRDLRAHVEQRLEGEPRLFDQGASAVSETVLREIADGEAVGRDDAAAVGLVERGEHLQERCLARAVRAAEADTLPVVDLPAHRVEQNAVAKRLAEAGELNHENRRVRSAGEAGGLTVTDGCRIEKRPILAQRPGGPRPCQALVRCLV